MLLWQRLHVRKFRASSFRTIVIILIPLFRPFVIWFLRIGGKITWLDSRFIAEITLTSVSRLLSSKWADCFCALWNGACWMYDSSTDCLHELCAIRNKLTFLTALCCLYIYIHCLCVIRFLEPNTRLICKVNPEISDSFIGCSYLRTWMYSTFVLLQCVQCSWNESGCGIRGAVCGMIILKCTLDK
jgi:hypothetical protein